ASTRIRCASSCRGAWQRSPRSCSPGWRSVSRRARRLVLWAPWRREEPRACPTERLASQDLVFYFATTRAAVSRATLIGFFVFTDAYGLAWAASTGLLAGMGWKLIGAAVPFALQGLFIGHRLYVKLDEARLLQVISALLAVLGTAGTAGAVMRIVR